MLLGLRLEVFPLWAEFLDFIGSVNSLSTVRYLDSCRSDGYGFVRRFKKRFPKKFIYLKFLAKNATENQLPDMSSKLW